MPRSRRFCLGLGLTLLAAGSFAQLQPMLNDREPAKPPTAQDIPRARAVELGRAFLKAISANPGTAAPRVSHTYPLAGMPSATWVLVFDGQHQLFLHAKTGRVMQYINTKRASEISNYRMMNTRNARRMRPATPRFSRIPAAMLLTPNSRLLDFNQRPVSQLVPPTSGLQARFDLTELPNGLPLFGVQSGIVLDFDPRDGSLIEFTRSADVSLPSLNPRLPVARATQIAQGFKGELPMNLYSLTGTNPKPGLGFMMPRPEGQRRRPSSFGSLRLVWIVRTGDREVWVDAVDGKVHGGVRAGRRPPRESRTGAG